MIVTDETVTTAIEHYFLMRLCPAVDFTVKIGAPHFIAGNIFDIVDFNIAVHFGKHAFPSIEVKWIIGGVSERAQTNEYDDMVMILADCIYQCAVSFVEFVDLEAPHDYAYVCGLCGHIVTPSCI